MKEVIVTTQDELDALPNSFQEFTQILITSEKSEALIVRMARGNSSVVARGNSSVVARGNSSVVARGNSSVVARENSSVVARENSSVVARENSSVVARENSSVVAWENSSVVAWGNSSVVAWENSSVEARENSSVEAWGNSGIHVFSPKSTVILFGYAVAWILNGSKVGLKRKTATIITPIVNNGEEAWIEREGVKVENKSIIVFKRVSSEFKTQEGTPNETVWEIGNTLKHPSPDIKGRECGHGKYHFCSRPYFCDDFREKKGDKYIAIQVPIESAYAWPNAEYPHKIGGIKATVLYECNRFGRKI